MRNSESLCLSRALCFSLVMENGGYAHGGDAHLQDPAPPLLSTTTASASQAPGQREMISWSFLLQEIHIHPLIPKVAAERDCCEVLGTPIPSCIIVLPAG